MEFFDTHSHYNDEKFDEDRYEIIKDIYKSGVTKFITVGYNIQSSIKAIEISKKIDYTYCAIGVSPNDVPERKEEWNNMYKKLEELSDNKKIVAIGEIGLDYYWNKDNKELQKKVFIDQIELANKFNLPIVIHTRDAMNDTIDILQNKINVKKRGIFHCCPQNMELIKSALDLGFYISFAGPITFKNSKSAHECVNLVPLDRLLIETDSPYLSPEPNRGKRNDSSNIHFIAEKVAEFKSIPVEMVAEQTYKNAKKIFSI